LALEEESEALEKQVLVLKKDLKGEQWGKGGREGGREGGSERASEKEIK
jgi:hypothetical protein